MVDYTDIDRARRILGLKESATTSEIKKAYRNLAKKYHPDHNYESTDKMINSVNWAYAILEAYCRDYKYNFSEESVARTYPHAEYERKWHERWYQSI